MAWEALTPNQPGPSSKDLPGSKVVEVQFCEEVGNERSKENQTLQGICAVSGRLGFPRDNSGAKDLASSESSQWTIPKPKYLALQFSTAQGATPEIERWSTAIDGWWWLLAPR